MSQELVYEISSAERAERIVDALTGDGYRVYPAPSPEIGKVRVYIDATSDLRQTVEGVVTQHDLEAVAIL